MSTIGYAQFLRAMGHDVRMTAGIYWFNVFPNVYQSFPFHTSVSREIACSVNLFKDLGCWIVRYPCDLVAGRKSYRLLVDNTSYSLESLSSKSRNQTRRALEQSRCGVLEFEALQTTGLKLNLDTLSRQGRKPTKIFKDYWTRYYRHAGQAEGAEAWGCFVGDRLAAYLVAFRMEDVAHVLIVRSDSELLRHYPNNALLFTYIQHCFSTGLREVSIGFEGLQPKLTTLDHFKEGMGFEKRVTGQKIDIAPWLRPCVPLILPVVKRIPQTEQVSKLAGLLSWYQDQKVKAI